MSGHEHHDHAPEYMPGVPAPLPDGEQLIWQGSPRWQRLAVRALHVRKVALYFALLIAWRIGSAIAGGAGLADALVLSTGLALLAAVAVGLLLLIAWQMARTTIYTITSARLILRFGIALPMTANIPYGLIQSAALKRFADGSGDIPVTVKPGQGVSWLIFWPHVRPWSIGNAQPMMRAVPEAEIVADTLARALARANGQALTARADTGSEHAGAGSFAAAAR